MVERLPCKQEVGGSNPPSSTNDQLVLYNRIQRAGIREQCLGIPGYLPMSNRKGAGRMPWLREATKDAASGEMPRGGAGFL